MNVKQKRAAERLEKALENCHRSGLKGGVFDSTFYVWPIDGPDPYEAGTQFFAVIDGSGTAMNTLMSLDGGAGV